MSIEFQLFDLNTYYELALFFIVLAVKVYFVFLQGIISLTLTTFTVLVICALKIYLFLKKHELFPKRKINKKNSRSTPIDQATEKKNI
jgi:hypothetical protein